MIVKEFYDMAVDNTKLFKIYSDQNFLLRFKDGLYSDIVVREDEINNFVETSIAIPSPIADANFLYSTFIGQYKNITQKQIQEGYLILQKALNSLNDDEAYRISFLFEEWHNDKEYNEGDYVLYNDILYKVIKTPVLHANPEYDKDSYQKVQRPLNLVEEWNSEQKKVYNIGDRTRVGEHIYESVIDNNTWPPQSFPAGWKLIQ